MAVRQGCNFNTTTAVHFSYKVLYYIWVVCTDRLPRTGGLSIHTRQCCWPAPRERAAALTLSAGSIRGGGTKTSDPEGGKEKLGGNTTAENSENSENAEGEREERKTHLGCSSLQAPTINRGGDWDLIGQLSGEGE